MRKPPVGNHLPRAFAGGRNGKCLAGSKAPTPPDLACVCRMQAEAGSTTQVARMGFFEQGRLEIGGGVGLGLRWGNSAPCSSAHCILHRGVRGSIERGVREAMSAKGGCQVRLTRCLCILQIPRSHHSLEVIGPSAAASLWLRSPCVVNLIRFGIDVPACIPGKRSLIQPCMLRLARELRPSNRSPSRPEGPVRQRCGHGGAPVWSPCGSIHMGTTPGPHRSLAGKTKGIEWRMQMTAKVEVLT
jgi:hypothetical protein